MERLRQALSSDIIRLQSLQSKLNQPAFREPSDDVPEPLDELFDGSEDEIDPPRQDQLLHASEPDPSPNLPPERLPLHLPSSYNTPAANHPFRQAELHVRIKQATRVLAALRDAISQKSFQYSHVMRSALTKSVQTRSRMSVINISEQISQYSRVYCQARAAMVRLGADEKMLNKFKLLTRDDVKASTAILDPNTPGSSTIRLSWIWETGARVSGSAPSAMLECK